MFRAETNTAQLAAAISAYTVNNLGSNVWFHVADFAYGQSVYNYVRSRMEDAGGGFTEVDKSESGVNESEFSNLISAIRSSDANAVVLGMLPPATTTFIEQAKQQGLVDEVAVVSHSATPRGTAAGGDRSGTYAGVPYTPSLDTGDSPQFVEAYRNAEGESPDNFARVGYDSLRLIAKGIRAAGSTDPGAVRDALAGGTFSTVLGDVTLREGDHQATNPVWMAEFVEAAASDSPGVNLLNRVSGDDALPPASALNCNR